MGEPSRGFLGCEGALAQGAIKWALEPTTPRVEAICPLYAPIEVLADGTSRPLNGHALWNLHTFHRPQICLAGSLLLWMSDHQ